MMTKKELKKIKKVIKVMNSMCPSVYGLKESEGDCRDNPSNCLNCWKLAVESRLKELKEIGGN